jgi:hypothetical protein
MVTDTDFVSSANAPKVDEESQQATWTEIAVMVIFTAITVLIVGAISVLMVIA